jgi:hypothetical protein
VDSHLQVKVVEANEHMLCNMGKRGKQSGRSDETKVSKCRIEDWPVELAHARVEVAGKLRLFAKGSKQLPAH